MRIVLGSDHAGWSQKDRLVSYLALNGYEVVDVGPENETESVDYPDYALKACDAVLTGQVDRAILICGTGIGMAITANKLPRIRAANVTIPAFGALCREHNDANVLTLSGRFIDYDTNVAIVDAYLSAEFEGERHQKRLDKIAELE
ncbi:MAG: ribose 5-phosphate isomerase B [Coriobacteriia bacterium]|nr:ribose 5-phosphate isomerase B [Coriobacteriia bacterium]